MNETAVAVAVLNLLFCLFRFFRTLAQRRLMATVWFLLAYFSFFFIIVAFEGTFSHRQGYTGDIIKVIPNTVAFISIYVFVCNLLFAAAEPMSRNHVFSRAIYKQILSRQESMKLKQKIEYAY